MLQSALSATERTELHRFLEDTTRKMPKWISEKADLREEIKDTLLNYDVPIKDEHIDKIIEASKSALELEEELVQSYGRALNPKVSLSIKMAASLGAIYYVPSVYANGTFNVLLKHALSPLIGAYSDPALGVVNILLQSWLTQFAPQNLLNNILPQLIETYGPTAYLIAPAGVLGYHLVTHTSREDLQHTAYKMAQMTNYCSGMISWLWKRKAPSTTASTAVTMSANDDAYKAKPF